MEEYPRTLLEFERRFATEAACRAYLAARRWPEGITCPRCQGKRGWETGRRGRAMAGDEPLGRITANPEIFGGKPIVRGMRISVELILSLLAQGETPEAILSDYPDLELEDIRACIAYAHAVIAHDSLDAVRVAPK